MQPAVSQAITAASVRERRQKTAYRLIWHGQPQEARKLFEQDAAYYAGSSHTFGYVRLLKGLFLSDLYAKNDAAAGKDLARVIAYVGREPAGDALIFRGDQVAAWGAYASESMHQPGYEMDSVVADGATEAIAGNLKGALSTWSGAAGGAWSSWGGDLQYALVGIAQAQTKHWRRAEQAWILGAVISRPASVDWATIWDGNVTSLAMLFHFRAHLERGENAYQWPLPANIGIANGFEREPFS
jgi:hypothetical protein